MAIDGRAPKFDGGIVTRLDCVPLGIVVNKFGERFYDEGEDLWPKRYAIWGRLVAEQPDQIAYSIIDSKVVGRFMPSVFPAVEAHSIAELAGELGLAPDRLETTVQAFNEKVRPGTFDHKTLDDCATEGLAPPKSHWAQRIDTPPFYGYPLRPGITFTYLSVRVNERAEVEEAFGKHFRGGRDYGRQRGRAGLSGRVGDDDRFGVRAHFREGGRGLCRGMSKVRRASV